MLKMKAASGTPSRLRRVCYDLRTVFSLQIGNTSAAVACRDRRLSYEEIAGVGHPVLIRKLVIGHLDK